jgi:hypothetical protein
VKSPAYGSFLGFEGKESWRSMKQMPIRRGISRIKPKRSFFRVGVGKEIFIVSV